jgi:hypothetical protein
MVFLLPAWANRPKEYATGGIVTPPVFSAPIRDQVMRDPLMKKGGIAQKQKVKQTQVVNVKVNVAPAEKKAKQRRRAPRAKKAVAGDSVLVQRGNVPPHYQSYAPHGEPMRLAGPGQSYANLPAPLQSARYASAPSVMNPQASAAFTPYGDLYSRNRNKNDDVREVVNPSDITPMAQPSKRLMKSETPPGSGYMPSASSAAEAASMGPAPFQGEVPRLNEVDTSPSMRAAASEPSDGFRLTNTPGQYPSSFDVEEELDEMAAEMDEDAGEFTSAAVSAFEPPDRRVIRRPKRVVGGEASGGSKTAEEVYRSMNVDNITNKDTLRTMLLSLGKGQPGVGDVSNLKRDPYWNGPGMIDRLRAAIKMLQQGRPLPPRGKEAAMRRGGSVF